jgi:hypothetical protein
VELTIRQAAATIPLFHGEPRAEPGERPGAAAVLRVLLWLLLVLTAGRLDQVACRSCFQGVTT